MERIKKATIQAGAVGDQTNPGFGSGCRAVVRHNSRMCNVFTGLLAHIRQPIGSRMCIWLSSLHYEIAIVKSRPQPFVYPKYILVEFHRMAELVRSFLNGLFS